MRFGTFFFQAPPGHHHAIRVGLAAAILPFDHPLRLAEQMALIDIHRRRPPARGPITSSTAHVTIFVIRLPQVVSR